MKLRFAQRLPGPTSPNQLSQLAADCQAKGMRLFDLMETNPTRAGFRYPPEAAIGEALRQPEILRYEPSALGLATARKAVATYYAERGWRLPPEHILLTASTSEAYGLLFQLLGYPGEEILYPVPGYPLVPDLAALTGLQAVPYPLHWKEDKLRWEVDFPQLDYSYSERTRAVVVVSPNNPTGQVCVPDQARLETWAGVHHLPIILDEVFYDYPGRSTPAHAQPGVEVLTFVLNGLSKICGLPQWKLGWIAVFGPEQLVSESISALERLYDSWLSVGTPVQVAAPTLLAGRDFLQRQIQDRLQHNEQWLQNWCHRSGRFRLLPRDGGWTALLCCPPGTDPEEICRHWLQTQGLVVHPGYYYDLLHPAVLALSLLTPPQDLQRLADI